MPKYRRWPSHRAWLYDRLGYVSFGHLVDTLWRITPQDAVPARAEAQDVPYCKFCDPEFVATKGIVTHVHRKWPCEAAQDVGRKPRSEADVWHWIHWGKWP